MNLLGISGLSIAVTSSLLILIIFRYRKNKLHAIWLTLNFFVALWGACLLIISYLKDVKQALVYWKITSMAGGILAPLFFHIVYVFCGLKKKIILKLVYIQIILFVLLDFLNLTTYKLEFIFNSFYYLSPTGVVLPLFLIFWALILIYSFYELTKFYFMASGVKKNQARYILFGMLIGFISGGTHLLTVFSLFLFKSPIYPFGQFGITLYSIIITYAILKHRLLDVKVAFTRGAILLVVYAFIVGIPLVFAGIGKEWLQQLFRTKWFYPPLALYSVLTLLAPYIYLTLQNKAEHKRMQRQIRLHQSLKAASQTTIEVQSIDKLSKIIPRYLLRLYGRLDNEIAHISLFLLDKDKKAYHLKSSVGKQKIASDTLIPSKSYLVKWFMVIRNILIEKGVLRAKDVEVLVYDDIDFWLSNSNVLRIPFKGLGKILKELKKIMKLLNANVILPSVYQKELLGFLILGEKTPDPYTESDIDTFSILANDSAMAFKAAQLFEELKTAQARLIQSEKLNLLGQLASSMAHEINNPLAIISGNIQLLLMDEKDVKKRKVLKKINDQTERGYRIINRLLNFSRLSKEDIKDIEVHALIDDTLELINHKILHGNIELDKEYNCTRHIKGNPTQIQEVLLNLFVNAVQAMPEGGQLKISTRDRKNKVEIIVQDTGKGIPEKDVANIFDPFYTHGKENGTGLGLFVASQIMGLHNGTIDVKSKVGKGTTFVLRFAVGINKEI